MPSDLATLVDVLTLNPEMHTALNIDHDDINVLHDVVRRFAYGVAALALDDPDVITAYVAGRVQFSMDGSHLRAHVTRQPDPLVAMGLR